MTRSSHVDFRFDEHMAVLRAVSLGDAWVEHGFGTRLAAGWPAGGAYASLRQIHSDTVVTLRQQGGDQGRAQPVEGDALVTALPGVWIGIRTADCVPILMADPGKRAIAAVHSGWRGTAAGIAVKALARLTSEFGSRTEDVRVAIGPAIGVCCYEVGPEVAGQFGGAGPVAVTTPAARPGAKPHLDLASTIENQLLAEGVRPEHLSRSKDCTRCGSMERFHSFRRDGEAAGRMVAAIRIRPGL